MAALPAGGAGRAAIARLYHDPAATGAGAAHYALEHFQAKWPPVRVKKMRQNKGLEHFCDSMKRRNALAAAAEISSKQPVPADRKLAVATDYRRVLTEILAPDPAHHPAHPLDAGVFPGYTYPGPLGLVTL